jgi:tRNA nucleotidyltransferase (CCA-adding enzyme)
VRTGWEHFAHGADIGVRGFGATLDRAFEQGGLALTGVIAAPDRVRLLTAVRIACQAPDQELLFVDWLNALVLEMATRHMLFGRFEVRLTGTQLEAQAWGEPVDGVRHEPAVEVKGATYTAVRVGRTAAGGWVAQCVVDV